MPTILTLSTLAIAFLTTLIVTPFWIRAAKRANLKGIDKHKKEKVIAAEVGGLPVVCGFLFAILYYIATRVFVYSQENSFLLTILAALVSILIATIIGFTDDILGWKIGLRIRYKVALTFFIALPIMVMNAGSSDMVLPIIGEIRFGILFPLLIIPLGIMGASNGFNMLAGYNGLEAGMGIIILSTLGLISFLSGNGWVAVLAFAMVFSLAAFFVYNRNPAKIFPGDTLTYSVGALIGIIAIIGNIEKYAVILFIPYFAEFILKARGNMKKESFARLLSDGSIAQPYDKIYGLEHLAIKLLARVKKRVYEKDVVHSLLMIEMLIASGTLLYFLM